MFHQHCNISFALLSFSVILILGMVSSSALRTLSTFRLGSKNCNISLMIAQGSVVDFSSPHKGAIVNAANEGCLGGGGVE